MKRILSIALAVALCFALAGSALAAFTPSVTYKPAPTLAGPEQDDGCRLIGYVKKGEEVIGKIHYNGEQIYAIVEAVHETPCGEGHKCLIMTPLADAETSAEIPEDSRDLLLWVYEQLLSQGIGFIQNTQLDEYIKQELGADKTINDLVVRDLFDVSVLCEELETFLEPSGTTVCLDFDLGMEPGAFVAVVAYKNDQWAMIENAEVMEDGSVVCNTYENFCPIAILVAAEDSDAPAGTVAPADDGYVPASTDAPETGVSTQNNVIVWVVVAVAALAALVVLFALQRKRKENQ